MSQAASDEITTTTGSCTVCSRSGIRVISTSGLLWKHGPRSGQCAGSYTRPVLGSIQASSHDPNSQLLSQQLQVPTSADDQVDVNVTVPSTAENSPHQLLPVSFIRTKIVKRIPKGARPQVSMALQNVINDVVRHPSAIDKWRKLFFFTSNCLRRPNRGGRSRNLTTLITKQTIAYSECSDVIPIEDEMSTHRPVKARSFDQIVASRASAKLEEGNVKGAVRLLCSNDKLATPNVQSFNQLLPLHPKAPIERRHVIPANALPLQVYPAAIRAAVQTFPAGSSAGPDNLRPQHLKDLLVGTSDEDPLMLAITDLSNILLAGETPPEVRKCLFGATLLAIGKKDGGVRPIAVGFVWRRLAAKVACRHITERCANLFSPRQLGVGIPGGAEAAVHATRIFLDNLQPGNILLKIDFQNAFNTVRRDVILEEIKEVFPELLPFADSTTCTCIRFNIWRISNLFGGRCSARRSIGASLLLPSNTETSDVTQIRACCRIPRRHHPWWRCGDSSNGF